MATPTPSSAESNKEARRRAGILDRYVRIRRATQEDDAAFAAELGLSLDSLARLATIWRRHRNEHLLLGRAAAIQTVGASDRRIFRSKIDLTGVPRPRRSETLRRIRLIQAHLRAIKRGTADLEATAAEAGLSTERFATLVRIWKLHADPVEMPGGSRRVAPQRKDPTRARMIEILRRIVDGASPSEPVRPLYKRYVDECRPEGISPLSLPRVYALIREFRAEFFANTSRRSAPE